MNYLVIGYGNTLRSDDGAGQKVVEAITEWNLKNVRSLALYQPTPELAEDIAKADTVIFVDAAVAAKGKTQATVEVQQLKSGNGDASLEHSCNPRSLLSLTQAIYGKIPPTYLILIPGINFDFGEKLSPITESAVSLALEKIKQLITGV
ncbi:MAG: hydrogenase maturation protease [Xenococcaceae cyanobacterium MO_234.B1]|nr:hydrogenase maturation protease [Xenococcaceae cyanobacterium MO_234.B1]